MNIIPQNNSYPVYSNIKPQATGSGNGSFGKNLEIKDTVSLSKEGESVHASQQEMGVVLERAKGLPELRQDKIFVAQENMKSGFYNSSAAIDSTAGKIIATA
ncbi:MAG: hypothetical protein HQK83_04255 [Fibrobacteria bacterium]|nr:hypothetical protein [Fibrobacteria bacterium]